MDSAVVLANTMYLVRKAAHVRAACCSSDRAPPADRVQVGEAPAAAAMAMVARPVADGIPPATSVIVMKFVTSAAWAICTTLWVLAAPPTYGGESHSWPVPLKVPTNGHALYAADATTGASVILSCNGFASTLNN